MSNTSTRREIVPGFFAAQRRARAWSAVLLGAIFVLLVLVASFLLIGVHSEQTCPDAGTCTTTYRLSPLALALTVAGVAAYLVAAPLIALAVSGVRERQIEGDAVLRVTNVVEELSLAAGVPTPHAVVIDEPSINAFALPAGPHGTVVVTSGAEDALTRRELTGVVAHEIGHLRNHDARVVLVGSVAVWVVRMVASGAARLARAAAAAGGSTRRRGGWFVAILVLAVALAAALVAAVLGLIALPAALLLRAALSRRREELADAAAVQYTRDPEGLRTALERIAAGDVPLSRVDVATETLWLDRPGRLLATADRWWDRLFDTHPPIEQRIRWLRAVEGVPPASPN